MGAHCRQGADAVQARGIALLAVLSRRISVVLGQAGHASKRRFIKIRILDLAGLAFLSRVVAEAAGARKWARKAFLRCAVAVLRAVARRERIRSKTHVARLSARQAAEPSLIIRVDF